MIRAIFLVTVLPLLSVAQTRDFFPWWAMPLSKNLSLSEEQSRQIHTTVREYRDKLVDLRANLEKSENQLSDLMNDDQPDQQRANGAIERAVQARAELTRTFAQMGFKLRLVLTPQQWRQLQQQRPMPQPGQPVRRPQFQPGPGGPAPGPARVGPGFGAPPDAPGPGVPRPIHPRPAQNEEQE